MSHVYFPLLRSVVVSLFALIGTGAVEVRAAVATSSEPTREELNALIPLGMRPDR